MVIPVNSEANTAQKVFNLENCIRFQTKPLRHFLCVSACTRRDLCFQDNNKLHGECLFNCECNSLSRACVFVCFASIRKCKSKNGRKRNERKALLGKAAKKKIRNAKKSHSPFASWQVKGIMNDGKKWQVICYVCSVASSFCPSFFSSHIHLSPRAHGLFRCLSDYLPFSILLVVCLFAFLSGNPFSSASFCTRYRSWTKKTVNPAIIPTLARSVWTQKNTPVSPLNKEVSWEKLSVVRVFGRCRMPLISCLQWLVWTHKKSLHRRRRRQAKWTGPFPFVASCAS